MNEKLKTIELTWAQTERLVQAMQILVERCASPPVFESVYWEQVELLQKLRNVSAEFQFEVSERTLKAIDEQKKRGLFK